MFEYKQIQSLNELESEVYRYVATHLDRVAHMRIRELADAAHVSTTTILRFCDKMGCEGFSEFKLKLKMYIKEQAETGSVEDLAVIRKFLDYAEQDEFEEMLNRAVILITGAKRVTFFGCSTSNAVAKYGARFLTGVGKFSDSFDDPFYPSSIESLEDSVFIILSISGETQYSIEQTRNFKSKGAKIIAITNSANSTIARMADVVLAYYMPIQYIKKDINITTHVPVVLTIEMLARRVQVELQNIAIKEDEQH